MVADMRIIKSEAAYFNAETCGQTGKASLIQHRKFTSAPYVVTDSDIKGLLREQLGAQRKMVCQLSGPVHRLAVGIVIL